MENTTKDENQKARAKKKVKTIRRFATKLFEDPKPKWKKIIDVLLSPFMYMAKFLWLVIRLFIPLFKFFIIWPWSKTFAKEIEDVPDDDTVREIEEGAEPSKPFNKLSNRERIDKRFDKITTWACAGLIILVAYTASIILRFAGYDSYAAIIEAFGMAGAALVAYLRNSIRHAISACERWKKERDVIRDVEQRLRKMKKQKEKEIRAEMSRRLKIVRAEMSRRLEMALNPQTKNEADK